ncbi:MAG: PorV/PorQ family protein, partial [Ignavibacteria bacterium]
MRKISLLILMFVLFTGISYSQNDGAGNTGLSFLKLGIGARSIAMGEAYSSLADDGTAFIYNPARMNASENGNVTAMFNKTMLDMTTNYVGAKFRIKKLGIGLGLLKTTVSDIEVRNTPGAPIDKFNADNFSGGISLSYEVYQNLSVGVTGKLIYEKLYIDESSGFGMDFGANYIYKNLSVAAVINNVGSMNPLRVEKTPMP